LANWTNALRMAAMRMDLRFFIDPRGVR
jgi:hypothetical protein